MCERAILPRDFRYGPTSAPGVALNEQTVPSVSSFTLSDTWTDVILSEHGRAQPLLPGLVTPTAPFRDTAARSPPAPHRARAVRAAFDHVGCQASRSMRPRICPKRVRVKWPSASCCQLLDEVPGMLDEAPAGFEEPLLKL